MPEKGTSKAQAVRDYLKVNPKAKNKSVAEALGNNNIKVTPHYVGQIRRTSGKKKRGTKAKRGRKIQASKAKYPRHTIEKVLRFFYGAWFLLLAK